MGLAAVTHSLSLTAPDFNAIRADFPMLKETVYGKPLTFLDSAASAQKPQAVLDSIQDVYAHSYANIHRGVYHHSVEATNRFEAARTAISEFINANSAAEIIFVRNATEAINLVAQSYGRHFLKEGDEVLITAMEHHANIVPWQMLRDQIGIILKVAPINDAGEVIAEDYADLLTETTKLVALSHVSNALGTVNPVKKMTEMAHAVGAKVLLDGCQAVPHMPVDVQDLHADFYVFSGHKLYGPSGIGVLYGKHALLDAMPPYQGGGEMISSVTFEKSEYKPAPYKFEAGTPAIAEAIGLGAAVAYMQDIGMEAVWAHQQELLAYGTEILDAIDGVHIIGNAEQKIGVLSFVMDNAHPHDIGTILDQEGVAIRAGHHCAQPVMERFGLAATARASIGVYTNKEDLDVLGRAISSVKELFG